MSASANSNSKVHLSTSGATARCVELALSPREAAYVRLLSAILNQPEEQVLAEWLAGKWAPGAN